MASDSDEEVKISRKVRRETKRGTAGTRSSHHNEGRLNALKSLKEGKRNTYNKEKADDLFDIVDQDEYSEKVRERLDDDWIVDDGSGYVENGRDVMDSDDEEESLRRRQDSRQITSANSDIKSQTSKSINNFFKTSVAKQKAELSSSNMVSKKPAASDTLKEKAMQDALDDLLSSFQPNVKENSSLSLTNTDCNQLDNGRIVNARELHQKNEFLTSALTIRNERKRDPSSPLKSDTVNNFAVKRKVVDVTLPKLHPDIIPVTSSTTDLLEKKASQPDYEQDKIEMKPIPNLMETETKSEFNCVSNFKPPLDSVIDSTSNMPTSQKLQDEPLIKYNGIDTLCMYWLDAYENQFGNHDVVYLFGRIINTANRQFVSCCVQVKKMERICYLLPRKMRFVNGVSTNQPVTTEDVMDELDDYLNKKMIKNFRCKATKKEPYVFTDAPPDKIKDAIGLDGMMTVIELLYSAKHAPIECDAHAQTFCHAFNTTATPLEHLLIQRQLKGPGWLLIEKPERITAQTSYCAIEYSIDAITHITPISQDLRQQLKLPAAPTVSVCAVNFVTVYNQAKNCDEIVCIGLLHHHAVPIDRALTDKNWYEKGHCFITKPHQAVLPYNFEDQLKEKKMFWIRIENNESAMLNLFLAKIYQLDPDLLVGHDLKEKQMLNLFNRLTQLKTSTWSRLGRLRRMRDPPRITIFTKSLPPEVMAGRILCDTKIAAQEFILGARSYDLGALVKQMLNEKRDELRSDEVYPAFKKSSNLLRVCTTTMNDAVYSLRLLHHMNAVPLTMSITNTVGGILSRTWCGGRSERNTFLLLHAFNARNHLCPDKPSNKHQHKRQKKEKDENDDEESGDEKEEKNGKKGKPTYLGGLVLEPQKGLYDTYILYLDFNSLYPTIIQEFNIDFTTIDVTTINEEGIPLLPASLDDITQKGVIPNELRILVERRKSIKKLLKEEKNAEKRTQYDITQLALKLTANSMYGCLGFKKARFYAKHLAALVTYKGREILQLTKNRVESMNYQVIYGDTDSIMINTNTRDLAEVDKIAFKIMDEVRRNYKLLELGIDGRFRSFLLLKKKKYAGILVEPQMKGREAKEELVMKGLDIVRRDWAIIAKETGSAILAELLQTQKERDQILNDVHQHLVNLASSMREGNIEAEKYLIAKALTRNPQEYNDNQKSQPHVNVALRLNQKYHMHLKKGDTIEYIICEDGTIVSAMQRAYSLRELKERKDELKIDITYYLSQQILPVVGRLIEPIEGTDQARIALCLGLDSTKYCHSTSSKSYNSNEKYTPNFDTSLCEPCALTCPHCDKIIKLTAPLIKVDGLTRYQLDECPHCSAQDLYRFTPRLVNELKRILTKYVKKIYKAPMACNDLMCKQQTRQLSTQSRSGRHPLCPHCQRGHLYQTYTENDCHNQLKLWEMVVDVEMLQRTGNMQKPFHTHASQLDDLYAQLKTVTMKQKLLLHMCRVKLRDLIPKVIPNCRQSLASNNCQKNF